MNTFKYYSIIITIITTILPNTVFSQNITNDKVDKNGGRYISTDFKKVYTEWSVGREFVELGLSCSIEDNVDFQYCLNIMFHDIIRRTIDKDNIILMKFEDGSVCELSNSIKVSNLDISYVNSKYITCIICDISEDQIVRIIDGKVNKIRIEFDDNNFDFNINGNKFSKRLDGCYELIKETALIKKDRYLDF